MINLKPIYASFHHLRLEYFNAYGLIFQNHIYLKRNDTFVHYDMADIARIHFKKERNLKYNFLSFFISFILAYTGFALANVLGNYKHCCFIVSGGLLLYSFLKKSYSFRIVMITTNQNIVSLLINENSKKQALKLVTLIKAKIKNNAHYLKVS